MSHCLNPQCPSPQNPPGMNYCQTCGTSLLLRGHYRAVRPLGRGGMGRTFLAIDEDTPSKRKCVIKQFSPAPDILNNPVAFQKSLELFKREAETLDRLGDESHQIPHLLAYLEREQQFYLVQEFIDGENLLEHLSHRDGYSEAEVRQLLHSLLPVLDFVHRQGVIHRDIKPENIMRCQTGRIVLIDFGISKQLDQTMVRPGTRGGTQGYAPPEQLVYGVAYPSSDLYALGTTCLHLLTQTPPHDLFDHYRKQWIWRSILQSQGKTVSPALGQILDKLLQEDHKQRYASARAVIEALEAPVSSSDSLPDSSSSIPSGSHSVSASTDAAPASFTSQPAVKTESTSGRSFQKLGVGLLIGVLGLGVLQINNLVRQPDPQLESPNPVGSPLSPQPSPLLTAATLIEQGDQFRQSQQWADAIDAYTRAIELDPDNAIAFHNRALVHHDQGNLQAALDDHNRAIEINPTDSVTYNNRGNVFYDQGNLQAALTDYNQAIEIDPTDAITYYNRGNVYRDQGNVQAALTDYNQAIEINPDYAAAYNNRGNVYYDQGNYQVALSDYTRAIEIDQNYADAYHNRGLSFGQLNQRQNAVLDLQRAALLYEQQGNFQYAQDALAEIQRLQQL